MKAAEYRRDKCPADKRLTSTLRYLGFCMAKREGNEPRT